MDTKKLFEGVDTSNIDINEIEKLSKESPTLTKEMAEIEKMYESFYEENKDKILKMISNIDFKIIPLLNIFDIINNKDTNYNNEDKLSKDRILNLFSNSNVAFSKRGRIFKTSINPCIGTIATSSTNKIRERLIRNIHHSLYKILLTEENKKRREKRKGF